MSDMMINVWLGLGAFGLILLTYFLRKHFSKAVPKDKKIAAKTPWIAFSLLPWVFLSCFAVFFISEPSRYGTRYDWSAFLIYSIWSYGPAAILSILFVTATGNERFFLIPAASVACAFIGFGMALVK